MIGIIESLDPKTISNDDLKKIAEIEKDMWSHGIGEYVKCNNCLKISSKQDIFGDLSKEIYLNTVTRIENILGLDRISCPNCGNDTNFIYDEVEYIEEIRDRYNNSIDSFLTVYRDEKGKIRGFIDGYMENFLIIYEREFKKYYGQIGFLEILSLIKKSMLGQFFDRFLLCSSVGMEGKYKNRFIIFELFRIFFENIINTGNSNITGLYEANIKNNIYDIYHSLGAKSIGTNNNKYKNFITNKANNTESDIFIHENIGKKFVEGLSGDMCDKFGSYLKYEKSNIY